MPTFILIVYRSTYVFNPANQLPKFSKQVSEQMLPSNNYNYIQLWCLTDLGKSSELVQCAMLKACDACTDMGQL